MFDRNKIKMRLLSERQNKFTEKEMWRLNDVLPFVASSQIDSLAADIVKARQDGQPVIWMMGAHPIRRGNSRLIIDLIRRGIITHMATSGAGAIHDLEFAMIGATCEDVEYYIKDGSFGNWEETGHVLNSAIVSGITHGWGFGKSIGECIACRPEFLYPEISIFASAVAVGVPITVHKSIGFDITDQHPSADYAALGAASGRDFLIFAESMEQLVLRGGLFLNFGSAVMGPEVFLKTLSMARNVVIGDGKTPRDFITANFDLREISIDSEGRPSDPDYYYRPRKTILVRSVKGGGRSYHIAGDFRETIPTLYQYLMKGDK